MADGVKFSQFPPSGLFSGTNYLVGLNGTTNTKWLGSTVLSYIGANIAGATYTVGDLVYASSANTLGRIPDVGSGNVLLSGGLGTAPSYGKVELTTHVSGVLPSANGGTGVNNGSNTLTLGGSLSTSGAYNSNFTMTNTTNVTFPTSGTLATVSQLPPALTKGEIIIGTNSNAVAGNIVSSDGSVTVDTTTDGEINLTVAETVLPTLGQGQLIIGVGGEDPVPGNLISSDDTIAINISVNGEIDLTTGSALKESLQEAYDTGSDIQLSYNTPLVIFNNSNSTAYESVIHPSSGSSQTGNYAIHGWTFVPSVNITVTALQYLDMNLPAGSRNVGIFLKSTSKELVSDKVTKDDPLVGYYRTKTLSSPLSLKAGVSYVIATVTFPSEIYHLNNDAVTSAEISAIEWAYGTFSANPIPLSCPTTYIAVPNVTPEAFFTYELIESQGKASFISGLDGDAAFFKIESTTLASLPLPVMTEAQIDLINSPYEGLCAWNSSAHVPMGYSNGSWKYMSMVGNYYPTGTTNPMASNNQYIAQSSSLVTMQMPTTEAYVGSKIWVIGTGTGGFKIVLAPGQYIKTISGSTSSGGYVTSVIPSGFAISGVQIGATLELTCTVENTTWAVTSCIANLLFQ